MNVEVPEDNRKREELRKAADDLLARAGSEAAAITELNEAQLRKRLQEANVPRWKNPVERNSKYTTEVRNQILDYIWKTQNQSVGRGWVLGSRPLERKLREMTLQEFRHLPLSYDEYRKTINGSSENTYARAKKYRTP